jgi:hypothetical protein
MTMNTMYLNIGVATLRQTWDKDAENTFAAFVQPDEANWTAHRRKGRKSQDGM